jgi:hypothetical protein
MFAKDKHSTKIHKLRTKKFYNIGPRRGKNFWKMEKYFVNLMNSYKFVSFWRDLVPAVLCKFLQPQLIWGLTERAPSGVSTTQNISTPPDC